MKLVGNLILIPIKMILFVAFLIATIGIGFSVILDSFCTEILSRLISICVTIIVLSAILYGTSLTNNISFTAIITSYVLIIAFTLLPLLLKGLQSLLKTGLTFWF